MFKDGEDANYRSRGYTGPRCQRDNEDPLAGEIMLSETVVTKEESPAVERLDQHSNIVRDCPHCSSLTVNPYINIFNLFKI